MTQFKFKTSEILQGDFKVANDLNLLLAFQVNCPGCFIYALPLAETLHNQYGNRLNVLGLSKAFEDFELNTVDHTKKAIRWGRSDRSNSKISFTNGRSLLFVIDLFPYRI